MRFLSKQKAIERLKRIKTDFIGHIARRYEHRAKSCATCQTPGACCLDEHFVNVHISRLEALAIIEKIELFSKERQNEITGRIERSITKYSLTPDGDTFAQTFACPLF